MLNIAYTFTSEVNKNLSQISKQLHLAHESVYVLGENSIPHMSLTHIEGDVDDAESMWEKLLEEGVPLKVDVVLGAFTVDAPWNGRVYTEFTVEGYGSHFKTQSNIMRIFKGREVFYGNEGDFVPHVTTSCHLSESIQKLPPQKARMKRLVGYLTIGTCDSYGRMESIVKGGFKV